MAHECGRAAHRQILAPSENLRCYLFWLYSQFREHQASRFVNAARAGTAIRIVATRVGIDEQGDCAGSECSQPVHAATNLGRDRAQPRTQLLEEFGLSGARYVAEGRLRGAQLERTALSACPQGSELRAQCRVNRRSLALPS